MQCHGLPSHTNLILVFLLVHADTSKPDTNRGQTVALTDTFTRNIKYSGAPAGDKHSDGGGMYLHITKAGKYWRMNYRFAGKQKTLALGVYPAVSLADARQGRDKARKLLAQGTDPSTAKREDQRATATAAANTFELVAREFHQSKGDSWSTGYAAKWLRGLEKDLFPYVGALALATITAPVLLDALRRIEKRGAIESAHTLRQTAGQVFLYGVQTGRCERNPALDLHGALTPGNVKHMAALREPGSKSGPHRCGSLKYLTTGFAKSLPRPPFAFPGLQSPHRPPPTCGSP